MSTDKRHDVRKRIQKRKKATPFKPLPKVPSRPLPPATSPKKNHKNSFNNSTYPPSTIPQDDNASNRPNKTPNTIENNYKNSIQEHKDIMNIDEGTESDSETDSSHSINKTKLNMISLSTAADDNEYNDAVVNITDNEQEIDDNGNDNITETDDESSIPSKGYHKGSVLIHDTTHKISDDKISDDKISDDITEVRSTELQNTISDDMPDKPYHKSSMIIHEDIHTSNTSTDDDDNNIGIDMTEIEQVVQETRQSMGSTDDEEEKEITSNIHAQSMQMNAIQIQEINNDSNDQLTNALMKHNIFPNKNNNKLSDMKKKIKNKRHMVTHSMFMTSTPPPTQQKKHVSFVSKVIDQKKDNHIFNTEMSEMEKNMLNKTSVRKIGRGHKRVDSLPPTKPLPSIKKLTKTIITHIDTTQSKSAHNTPVSPKKSVSKGGGESPYAMIDNDELPNMDIAPHLKYSQSHEDHIKEDIQNDNNDKQQYQSKTPATMLNENNINVFGYKLSEQQSIDVICKPSIMQSRSCITPDMENVYNDGLEFEFNPNNPNPQTEYRNNRNMYQSQPNIGKTRNKNAFVNNVNERNRPNAINMNKPITSMQNNRNMGMDKNKNRNFSVNGFNQMHVTPKIQNKTHNKRISFNDFSTIKKNSNPNRNKKINKSPKNNQFGRGIHFDHPSNRKKAGNRNAINKIRQQMIMKMKAKKQMQKQNVNSKVNMPNMSHMSKIVKPMPIHNTISAPALDKDDTSDREITPEPFPVIPINNNTNKKLNKRAGSLNDFRPKSNRPIQKRKNGKRRIRQNIFATAGNMTLNEQQPKFDPISGTNIKVTPKKKPETATKPEVPELILTENLIKNNINDEDSSSGSSSDSSDSSTSSSSSVSSEEDKKHVKRRSNFRIKTMKHAQSPRFGSRKTTPVSTPKSRTPTTNKKRDSGIGMQTDLKIITANKPNKPAQIDKKNKSKSKSVFSFGTNDVTEHQTNVKSGVYNNIREQRTKTPLHMPSTLRRKGVQIKANERRFNMGMMKDMSKSVRNLKQAGNKDKMEDMIDRTRTGKHTSMTYADYKRMRKLEEEKQQMKEFGSSISWVLGDIIGKGAFGTVYKGMEKKTGKLIAIKEFKYTFKNREKTLSEFEKETKIMKKLKHVNIVEFYDYKVDENNRLIFLVMEYVPGNSIESIYVNKGAFSEVMIQKYVYQIINGLHYAHSCNIIHRDIKGKNILIDNEGIVKIADFGSAILTEKDNEKDNVIDMDFESTPLWTAPECLIEGKYEQNIDIWSTGCCIIEMATSKRPWNEIDFKSPFQALYHIGNTESIPQWPKSLSIQCQAFIAKCLIRDPRKRYNTKQLLQHPFLKINHKKNAYTVDHRVW